MTAGTPSRIVALATLLIMVAALLLPAPSAFSMFVAVPLAILLATGIKPPYKWGGWVGAFMIPYFGVAFGEFIANPASRFTTGIITIGSIAAFFAAMDYVRRAGINLRR